MNTQRNYAHEVVTAVMHNVVPNLSVAQRACDQAEYLREINAELLAALGDLLNPMYEQACRDGQHWAMSAREAARAAIRKARDGK